MRFTGIHFFSFLHINKLDPETLHAIKTKRERFNAVHALIIGVLVIPVAFFLGINNVLLCRNMTDPAMTAQYAAFRGAYGMLAVGGILLLFNENFTMGKRRPLRMYIRILLYVLLTSALAYISALDFISWRDFSAFIILQLLFGWVVSTRLLIYPLFLVSHLTATLAMMYQLNTKLLVEQRAWILPVLYSFIAVFLSLATENRRRIAWRNEIRLTETNAALRKVSFLDPLTGLYNRRYLTEILISTCALARRGSGTLSIIMLDIDHFKAVNDQYGHAVGDQVLIYLAKTIQASLRESDIAARFGGEEFILLLPNTNAEGAVQAASRILSTLRLTCPPGLPKPVTASAGVASLTAQESDEALLERADQALYEAKGQGRDQVRTAPIPSCV